MDVSEVNDKLVRDRAIRLFTFLKELAQLRTKVTRDLSAYDHVAWFHKVPEYKGCFSILSAELDETRDGVWLEVRRPKEPQKPSIPSSCLKWLDDSSEADPLVEPRLRDEIATRVLQHGILAEDQQSQDTLSSDQFEQLADHPEILEDWQHYIQDEWLPWAETYKTWKAANDLYFQLFAIHQQIKKLGERYELLLGLGLLTWETPNNQRIKRHIVVGDAYLTFDADRAKFELQGAPEGIKLRFEADMVEQGYLPPLEEQRRIESLLDSIQESPWDKDELNKVLRSWIQSMSPDGTYSDSLVPPEKCTRMPTVTFAPAIILRERTQRSQVQCFANIAEQISNGGNIPSGVQLLCEISENAPELDDDETRVDSGKAIDNTLYLPLPVNEEQRQIVNQIRNRRGVLVQGPPGTGKSHTIANLICHLLAQGKRVLVTSQTPRALRVLKDKIPKDVAALCVTLLGNDQAARQELEGSVQSINQKYSEWNQVRSQEEITSLKANLFETQKNIADKNRLLREQREIETYQHQVAGGTYSGTAQQIACRVKEEEEKFAWIADDIGDNEPCPLSSSEFIELVQLYRKLPEKYCSELKQQIVSREDIPDAAHFVKMVDAEKAAKQNLEGHSSRHQSLRFRILEQLPEDTIQSLHSSVSGLTAAIGSIKQRFIWIPQAVSDMLSDNDTPWKDIHDFMATHLSGLREKAATAQAIDIQIPDAMDRRSLRADAQALLGHLQKGGRIGWKFLAPQVVRRTRYIMDEVRLNGQACSTIENLAFLVDYLDLLDKVEHLWSVWEGRDKKEEASLLVQVGYLEERLEALEAVIGLESYLNVAKANVKAIDGLAEPQWHRMEELEEVALDLEAVEAEHAFKHARSAIEDSIQKVRVVQSSPKGHMLNQELLTALEERGTKALARCLDKLETLELDHERLLKRDKLHEQLNKAAPKLARQLQSTFADSSWEQRSRDFEATWAWKQADSWLNKFNQEHDRIKLETELQQRCADERKTISKLAAAKAWENCLQRMTEHQRANLIAWAKTIKKIGKGTGKYAPMYRRQAQQYMDECKGAIPAWVMPLYRVFETVKPEPETFDAIIVDEASQTGPEGLVILYLAKQCIVVGDDEQIAPEAVGIDLSEVNMLIKKYLKDIPFNNRYDPQASLFDQADIRFKGRIVLREHFRCMPEIIQFSNNLFYKAAPLKPLRQYPPQRLEPIIVRHIKDGFREGPVGRAVNCPEADALVDTIVEFCSLGEYANKTMGVISLQGEAQAKYIESKLLTRLSPTELERRRVVCGDAYAFQGDERDIIFMSMVAAPNERIGALTREPDRRRFNVAASRARDQIVLFHTATLNDLNPDCMRHHLLKYYSNPVRQRQDTDLSRCESQFEGKVCLAIANKGYKVIPQYQVAGYRIDLVIEGTRSQLAVECDGDEWHGIEQYEGDVARQRVLERCGWRFWRIRGGEYYRGPEGSLESLWRTLSKMGIHPLSDTGFDEENSSKHEQHSTVEDIGQSPQSSDGIGLADITAIEEEQEPTLQTPPPSDSMAQQPQARETKPKSIAPRVTESKIYNYPADYFFSLAHWAKENGKLDSWERHLVFNIGKYMHNGWQITQRMERQALRIMREAKEAGFSEGKSEA